MFVSLSLAALFILNLQPEIVHAQGTAFTYQGLVTDNGTNFNGTGQFEFALVTTNGTVTTWWSNDGTSMNGSEPSSAVSVAVNQGLFTVILGDTSLSNMTAIPSKYLSKQSNLQLLIWFNDGVNGFAELNPPQSLTPVPEATFAAGASNLLGTLPAVQLGGTVPLAQLPAVVVTNNETGVTLDSMTVDSLTLQGTLVLPALPVIIDSGGSLLLYADNDNDFFAGPGAGNTTIVYTGGFDNTGIGNIALQADTSGSANTAVGLGALRANTSGNNNTAIGIGALNNNTTGGENTAIGSASLGSNTNGDYNTATGYASLNNNRSGANNTADGNGALYANTSGSANTADGNYALYANTNGQNNTANGYLALENNTSGNDNSADGYLALASNMTGVDNTANGASALQSNMSGFENAANGAYALQYNSTGNCNTGNGVQALWWNRGGNNNTADGFNALENLGSFGIDAGGNNNIALGYGAGSAFTANESSNIDIGNLGVAGENNIIRIGTPGIQTATYLSGTVYANSVALSSDRNAKENFVAVNAQAVLEKVVALPITEWNYKTDKTADHIGPMAQDFKAAFGLDGADDKHISVVDEGGVALAAIQGLNQKLETLSAENQQLKQENNLLVRRLDELEAQIKPQPEKTH
jgi:hypothetical protein